MGNKNHKPTKEEQKSNSSVLNLSLESNKDQISNSLILDNHSDLLSDLKKEIILPIENEYIESSELLLEGKEEFKIRFFFENNDDFLEEGIFNKKRSKTFAPKIQIKNTPKPHPLESNLNISPLKLSTKSFGNFPKIWNKKLNSVLNDFQKNIIDSKSCNDEDSLDDFFFFNAETGRTTPNEEDLHDLLNCRKKMKIFRNSINDRMFKEYENILNSDYMFEENKNFQKKNNFWYKHIKQQQLKDKMNFIHTKRLASEPLVKISGSPCNEDEDNKNHGLFILGILESAANEKKERNTVNG